MVGSGTERGYAEDNETGEECMKSMPGEKAVNHSQISPLSPRMSLMQLGLVCSLFTMHQETY